MGGAERQAFELAKRLNRERYTLTFFVLHDEGEFKSSFQEISGLRLVILRARTPLGTLLRVIREIHQNKIQIVHSFLYATHVYSLLARCLYPRIRLIIGLRDSLTDPWLGYDSQPWHLRKRAMDLCLSGLCRMADVYLANSEAAKAVYENRAGPGVVVIPNGIDTQRFTPDFSARVLLRSLLGVPVDAYLVGIIANFSVYKDYPTFIRAAKEIAKENDNVHFVSIGNYCTSSGSEAKEMVRENGLSPKFHFLGMRTDIDKLIPGLDILCSSSISEGFSNAIAEAMACGIPCVVTDVGDSRKIVADAGIVVPVSSHTALADGVISLLNMEQNKLQVFRNSARQRIVDCFSVERMVLDHQQIYQSLVMNTASTS